MYLYELELNEIIQILMKICKSGIVLIEEERIEKTRSDWKFINTQ